MSSARKAWSSIVVIDGSSSTVDASTPRPDLGPQHPEPDGREEAGVEREEQRARRRRAAARWSTPASRCGCAPGDVPRAGRWRAVAPGRRRARRRRRRDEGGRHAARARAASAASPRSSAPRSPAAMTDAASTEGDDRQQRQHERGCAVGPHPAACARAGSGRSRHAGAGPTRSAGEPGPALARRHAPEHCRARGDLGVLADAGAGKQRAASADGAVRRRCACGRCARTSPSIQ